MRTKRRTSSRQLAWLACLAFSAGLAGSAWGQAAGRYAAPHPTELRLTQFVHDAWTVDDGLPQNAVLTLEQTSDGYLWIATQAGLVRFDGFQFDVYDRQDGLGHNEIRSLEAGREGLWIGTHGGGLSRMAGEEITTWTTDDGLPSNLVRSLLESRDGTLWVGTIEGGLTRFDGEHFEHFGTEDGLAGNVVLTIEEDPSGTLWIGTEAGLSVYDGRSFTNMFADTPLAGSLVWALERDADGSYLVGISGGLVRVRDGSVVEHLTRADGLCGDVVDALHLDINEDGSTGDGGALWIGTLGGGLCRLAGGRFEAFRESDGLTNDRVRALLEDEEGNVWIGTESGLNRLRRGKFIHTATAEGLTDDMVMSVMEDRSGAVWVGTKSGGLHRIDAGGNIWKVAGLPSEYVSALHEGAGGIWVGMYGGGMCRLEAQPPGARSGTDPSASPLRPHSLRCWEQRDGLPSENVYAVYEDDRGRIWIGTDAGLVVLDAGRTGSLPNTAGDPVADGSRLAPLPDGTLAGEPISFIHQDREGAVWVGSQGLTRIRGEEVRRLGPESGFPDAIVTVLYEDAAGVLWAGTYGSGLCRITPGREDVARCVSTQQGLPSDQILQLLVDHDGALWIGSQQGIARVDVAQVSDVLEGRRAKLEPVTFGRADGIKSAEVNGGTQPSAWKAGDGRLLFATSYGVAMIDPGKIRTNDVPPPVHVQSVEAGGEPVALDGSAVLPPGRRDVTFHYTGISFTAPEAVRFRYRLEGYDAAWIDAGTRRDAYYTNLGPGEYTFRVAAANHDGVWNEEGAAVTFYLEPFFYETWWFAVLCGMAALGLTAGGYRLRIRQLRAREKELEQQVSERTRDLRREKERTEEAKQVIEGQAEKLRVLNEDLEAQAEKLRDLNENLQAKVQEQFELLVEERQRYEADLIDAKERAEASDRLKTAILNNLSHEFRTPLTAILGFTEIISMEAPDELKEFTGEIDRGGKRLLRTLDALLEFSRLEADESGMRPEPVDLTTTAFSVVRDLKKVAEGKDLPVHFRAAAPVRVILDAAALEEIIWNLVDNAVKFTSEGFVEVSAGVDDGRAYVAVRDTGVGIGADFRERMYDAFAQESEGFDRAFEGVGLGLTITRRLVEHMGGTIAVESTVGAGSTFTVYFPLREAADPAAA